MTEWCDIKGYETIYCVSNEGEVFSYKSNKILRPTIDSDGYMIVGLYKDGAQKKQKVHRLVAEHFLENPLGFPQVNHKDENKQNNNVENLEWCDEKYNINYGNRNAVVSQKIKECQNRIRRKVGCFDLSNNLIKTYRTLRDVEKDGFNHGAVFRVCSQKYHDKTHKGYIWRYLDELSQHQT